MSAAAEELEEKAPVFAALGDTTRLALVARLGEGGGSLSITRLTAGTGLTRQAVTKHLRVLESAGLVRGSRHGRERRFRLEPEPLAEAGDALEAASRRWDRALERLKVLVESDPDGGFEP